MYSGLSLDIYVE